MSTELHLNKERGHVDHGWLKSAHSFSFARYVNPDRMNFGALLVLNEDTIQPKSGFGEHYHDNMEIITIPLSGALTHQDSIGNHSIIKTGDIQIMSAGTGIMHSERNDSLTESVHLLQIWITPKKRFLPTRYEQITLPADLPKNQFNVVVGPEVQTNSLLIHQDAWLSLGQFETTGQTLSIQPKTEQSGLFLFVIDGQIRVNKQPLSTGDAIAITDSENVTSEIISPSHLLLIEVPLQDK